jgi:hypothetical protein
MNLIGANGSGWFPRSVGVELDLPTGRTHDLAADHVEEIRSARERFGQRVFAAVEGRFYKFKRLGMDGSFELQKGIGVYIRGE